ncbi:MAG: cupin domain-containing protein [Oscillospiraceae bacterium]|nr:cupin domain-containing protein [Oscillospiraceae bacterium]
MHMILLSGGSGKRLWPLSNETRSKQFIKIFRHGDDYESMVQRVYRQIRTAIPEAEVTIATSKSQVSALHNQLGSDVGISIEPCRRDTFPAIALATAYLHDVLGVGEDEAVVVCPVDPYVDESYFSCLKRLYERAQAGESNLVLMGIEPTYPSAKYGYIIPDAAEDGRESYTFREKPTEEVAKNYIAQGALWNGGVFAYRLRYVLEKSRELLGSADYAELYARYDTLRRISFDYAVAEREKSIEVLRYAGTWKDLGTWNTLTEAMQEQTVGEVMLSDNCENVHAINELGVPILVMGGKNLVVSASPSGILVTDKEQSSYIKPLVDAIDQQVMFAEKSWGSFLVLDVEENSLTIKVTLNPGHRMNYHSHDKRDEVWTVISGTGRTIVDGMEQPIRAGDVVTMQAGCKHTVIADTKLKIIEVQLGAEISVADKHKYEFPE